MKTNQRLGYQRLAEELIDRDLIDREAAHELLQQGASGGTAFPISVIDADLATDWELSRIVCELYNLPFLTVETAKPSTRAMEGLDPFFLMQHLLVPLCRHGNVLTVLMPGIVPAEVLGQFSSDSGLTILPVVGTVRTNQEWMTENLSLSEGASDELGMDPQWSALFDDADAAVLSDLDVPEPDMTGGAADGEDRRKAGDSIPFDGGAEAVDGQAA